MDPEEVEAADVTGSVEEVEPATTEAATPEVGSVVEPEPEEVQPEAAPEPAPEAVTPEADAPAEPEAPVVPAAPETDAPTPDAESEGEPEEEEAPAPVRASRNGTERAQNAMVAAQEAGRTNRAATRKRHQEMVAARRESLGRRP